VFAVAVTLAMPELFVDAVKEGLNVADAPEAGGVNVTATPETGFPLASVTNTESEVPNAVPTAVLWGLPPLTATLAAGPAALVRENDAGVATPVAAALTE
jgi:hypothetical protein